MEEQKVEKRQNYRKKPKSEKQTNKISMIEEIPHKTRKDIAEEMKHVDSALDELSKSDPQTNEKQIRKQIEFYFGDSNLRNDKFLYDIISSHSKGYVDLQIFLEFNRIKQLTVHLSTKDDKLAAIRSALSTSELLKLSKDQTKVKRKVPFFKESNPEKQNEIDKRVIYVEDFPEDSTHDSLAHIFSKVGKVLHVSLPKYPESKTLKGFGFIEYTTEEEAKKAIEKFNNVVPEEMIDDHISKGKVSALKVMSKENWLKLKQEFKQIKKMLLSHLGDQDVGEKSFSKKPLKIERGSLIRLMHLPKEGTDKTTIKIMASNIIQPKYVDYKKGHETCTIRFLNSQEAQEFLKKSKNSLVLNHHKIEAESIIGEEEELYIEKVEKHQTSLRKQYLDLKKKKKSSKNQEKPQLYIVQIH